MTEIKNVSTEESKLTLSKILTLLKHAEDIFNGSNLEEKSEFLKIISSNFSLKGKTVSFFYKNLIQLLSKSDPCLNILRDQDSNLDEGIQIPLCYHYTISELLRQCTMYNV